MPADIEVKIDAKNAFYHWIRQERSPFVLIAACIVFISLLDNQHLFGSLNANLLDASQSATGITLSVILINIGFLGLLLSLFAFRPLLKPALIFLLMTSAISAYFMDTYSIVIDSGSLNNVVETDRREALELMSWSLLQYIVLLGLLPSLLVAKLRLKYKTIGSHLLQQSGVVVVSVLVVATVLGVAYKDLSLFARQHRDLRYYFNPGYPIYSLVKFSGRLFTPALAAITPIGLDAKPMQILGGNPGAKKSLFILVVGETARAANFSHGGYPRDTNRYTAKQDVFYFRNVHSCGTATAESLPCMFSLLDQKEFSIADAKAQENLLDVLQHAGIQTLWVDNNSGCKDVCNRVEYVSLANETNSRFCNQQECADEILVDYLSQRIAAAKDDMVIVLHQKGSHGPAYAKRHPNNFSVFSPECQLDQVEQCTQQEIINAYDNTILYTDYVLSQIISLLQRSSKEFTTAMLYVSDHGESLGEYGIYLHGLPYSIAPDLQTHVPMLLWLSQEFKQKLALHDDCMNKTINSAYTHDNLFHSVLGMMDVETTTHNKNLDIVNHCRGKQPV